MIGSWQLICLTGTREYNNRYKFTDTLESARALIDFLKPFTVQLIFQGFGHKCQYSIGTIALWSQRDNIENIPVGYKMILRTSARNSYYKYDCCLKEHISANLIYSHTHLICSIANLKI